MEGFLEEMLAEPCLPQGGVEGQKEKREWRWGWGLWHKDWRGQVHAVWQQYHGQRHGK